MITILIIILVLLLLGAIPIYPYNANWGPYPVNIVGILLIILLVLMLTGRL